MRHSRVIQSEGRLSLSAKRQDPRCWISALQPPTCHVGRRHCTTCNATRKCIATAKRAFSCWNGRRNASRPCRDPARLHAAVSSLGQSSRVAVSVNWPERTFPSQYGHVWYFLYHFYASFVQPRLAAMADPGAAQLPVLELFLPAPDLRLAPFERDRRRRNENIYYLKGGPSFFVEVEELFSNDATRLRIHRSPWVPYCHRGCCWSTTALSKHHKQAPLEHEVALVHNFPDFYPYRHPPRCWKAQLRDGVVRILQLRQRPRVVTWMLSAGANARRIYQEEELVEAVRRSLPPGWTIETLDAGKLSYGAEVRAVASSAVLVSLFGSALNNCIYMARGSTVLEIHAALKNDYDHWNDHLYRRVCEEGLGLNWAGFMPATSVRPRRDPSSGALQWAHGEGNRSTERWAFVEPAAFARFVARALRAHESGGEGLQALRDEYNARALAERDPRGIGWGVDRGAAKVAVNKGRRRETC